MTTTVEELAIARRVVAEAADLVRGAAVGRIATKSNPRDLVTEWDHRLEERIRARLGELAPGVAIVGEEAGASGGDAARGDRWLIDPIDGTVNFAHGLPLWGITVALERDGAAVVGVIDAPALGWTMWAARGGGAWLGDQRLAVSAVADLEGAMLSTGFPYDRASSRHNFREWDELQVRAGAVRRLGAASLDLALVARGVLDGYWESRLEPWDVAAGALMVAEAGGRVTDLRGGRFESARGAVVATNGLVHDAVLAALADVDGIVRGA